MSGYKIIDLQHVNLTDGVAVTINGIYEHIESNNKATILTNIVIDNIEQDSVFVQFVVNNKNFETKITQGTIVITDSDTITLTKSEV